MKSIITLILLGFSLTCSLQEIATPTDSTKMDDNYQCRTDAIVQFRTQNEITALFDDAVIKSLATANAPDQNGAMSKNKSGYFSVRFQMALANLADYAIDSNDSAAFEALVKAIEYSFQHQSANGDFEIAVPPNSKSPTAVDRASTNAFFLSSLGVSLLALQENSFYNHPQNIGFKHRIESLRPKIETSLNWLISNEKLLEKYDSNTPNRLFFDAIAFYSLGKWLNNAKAKNIGVNFAQLAISKKSDKGYFLENGGWDSSYQGVSLANGFKLLSILDSDEKIKQPLWDSLSCAANWQLSRISSTGEISTEGNTRVYDGGEKFLGEEKQIAWKSTAIAFYTMKFLTGNAEYEIAANKLREFYR
jgi:hypothetical protein